MARSKNRERLVRTMAGEAVLIPQDSASGVQRAPMLAGGSTVQQQPMQFKGPDLETMWKIKQARDAAAARQQQQAALPQGMDPNTNAPSQPDPSFWARMKGGSSAPQSLPGGYVQQ